MKLRYKSASFSRDKGGTSNLHPRALLRMTAREEELSGTLEQDFSDWFQKKIIKAFLIGPFKFVRERVNVRHVWRVSGLLK